MVRTAIFAVLLLGASLREIAPAGQSAIREPLEVARVLAARYPAHPVLSYILVLSWWGALRLRARTGKEHWREKPRQQMMPFVSGEKPSIAEPYTLASL